MPDFISDTLMHWTGRNKPEDQAFDIIRRIVESRKLLLTYCPNYTDLPEKLATKTQMVCFTDIPLSLSREHCESFGEFGVGFNKKRMMAYGANPVLYTTDEMRNKVHAFISLVKKLHSEEVDRESRSQGDRYQFTSEQFWALFDMMGLTQEYSYDDDRINYYQREWRISYNALIMGHVKGGGPQTIPGQGAMFGRIPNTDKFACSMLFDVGDIDYLVVPEAFRDRAALLANPIGCPVKIYEQEVNR
jgi:hypothetical protein